MTDTTLRWGIIGTGNIASRFASQVPTSATNAVVAVGSRSIDSANAFADKYDITNRHGSYDDLLADPDVDAVYVATPHPMHPEWAIKAAEAGKHVLCEKPLAINKAWAEAMIEAAVRNDVFLMEAYMYRCLPQTKLVAQLVRDGELGTVHQIQATFAFAAGFRPESRIFADELAGGGILDVGRPPAMRSWRTLAASTCSSTARAAMSARPLFRTMRRPSTCPIVAYRDVVDQNLLGTVLPTRVLRPFDAEGAGCSIVNVSSHGAASGPHARRRLRCGESGGREHHALARGRACPPR